MSISANSIAAPIAASAPTDNVSMHEDIVRAGLNYHFGWGK